MNKVVGGNIASKLGAGGFMVARKPRERLAQRILQGLEEGLEFTRGEIALKTTVFRDQPPPMKDGVVTKVVGMPDAPAIPQSGERGGVSPLVPR
ncbi:MAG: hypothetical protein ACKV2Q_20095 [Planctomycetaceae bacterium]